VRLYIAFPRLSFHLQNGNLGFFGGVLGGMNRSTKESVPLVARIQQVLVKVTFILSILGHWEGFGYGGMVEREKGRALQSRVNPEFLG
jgi:hypothetical protein